MDNDNETYPRVATGDLLTLAQPFIDSGESFLVLVFEADNWQYLIRRMQYNLMDSILDAMFAAIEHNTAALDPSVCIGARLDTNRYVLFMNAAGRTEPIDAFIDRIRADLLASFAGDETNQNQATCSVAMALCPGDPQVLQEVLASLSDSLSYYSMPSVTTTLSPNTVDIIASEPEEGEHRSDIAGMAVSFETMPIYELKANIPVAFHFLGRNGANSIAKTVGLYHQSDTDYATKIDLMCIEQVLSIAATVHRDYRCHINVHPSTLANSTSSDILDLITKHDTSPEQVAIEVSFKRFPRHLKAMFMTLKELRDAGCHLSYSDAGWGNSPIEALITLQPDFIKLDRSVVTGAYQSTFRGQMLRRLVGMLEPMGATIIAEGVENDDDLAFVNALDIRLAQGHYFNQYAIPRAW